MPILSIWTGALMVALGVVGYLASGMVSPTALIPAVFGLALMALGFYGRRPEKRRTAMHLAMGVALIGIIGSIGGLPAAFTWLSGGVVARPAAAISKALMTILMLGFLGLGIRSFIAARRTG